MSKWKLLGLDAYEYDPQPYFLGEYDSEQEALEAAYKRLTELEKSQPSSESGGQRPGGIQDRVYVESPDGIVKRILPPSE